MIKWGHEGGSIYPGIKPEMTPRVSEALDLYKENNDSKARVLFGEMNDSEQLAYLDAVKDIMKKSIADEYK